MCASCEEASMSMQQISVLVPPSRPVPAGAVLAAAGAIALLRSAARLASAMAGWVNAMRARGALKRVDRRAARDRDEVLAMARRYSTSQPELAKDLLAAAARSHS
jgi:uncharacterized protein YjiS (DUF1127 family)